MRSVDEVLLERLAHGERFAVSDVVADTGASRQAVHRRVRALVDVGDLAVEGAGPSTRYVPTARFHAVRAREGLTEADLWAELEASGALSGLSEDAVDVAQYAVTEMVNNAIEHSSGDTVELRVRRMGGRAEMVVSDDGVGVWRTVRDAVDADSPLEAVQAVSLGKVTRAPEAHTGEGLFFTSKAVHLFRIESEGVAWVVDNERGEHAIGASDVSVGTRVVLTLDATALRPLVEVFDAYTDEFRFARTRAVVKLFDHGTRFVSRSEAKRLARGLADFDDVIVDFTGVRLVGQGFVDELFRVWASAHPAVTLTPVGMVGPVEFMVRRGLPQRTQKSKL